MTSHVDAFEWAVTAAMSISAHLWRTKLLLALLDACGAPAFLRSRSAPDPDAEEFVGPAGLAVRGGEPRRHPAIRGGAPPAAIRSRHPVQGQPSPPTGPLPFDDRLMDKLSAHRLRGPLLAVAGMLSLGRSPSALAGRGSYGANAFALMVTEPPRTMTTHWRSCGGLAGGRGGHRQTSLPAAWSAFDEGETVAAAAPPTSRGAAVPAMTGPCTAAPRPCSSPATSGTADSPPSPGPQPDGPGAYPGPWPSFAVAVAGAALSLNGVLRGWAWFMPVITTVVAVAFTLAALRRSGSAPLPPPPGGLVALGWS